MNLQWIREKAWEKEESIFSEKVARPVSYYPAWLFIKIGVSANTVTCLSFILGLAGLAFIALGSYTNMAIGASLLLIHYFLDRVDGSVARATGTSSKFGGYLDGLGDRILDIPLPVVLAFGIMHSQNLLLQPNIYLYVGLAYTFFRIVRQYAALLLRTILTIEPIAVVGSGILIKVGKQIIFLETLLLFTACILGIPQLFLLLYAAVALAELLAFVYMSSREIRTHDAD